MLSDALARDRSYLRMTEVRRSGSVQVELKVQQTLAVRPERRRRIEFAA